MQPPTPLRIAIALMMLYIDNSVDYEQNNAGTTYLYPFMLPLLGILHMCLVHISSLWSDRVHSIHSLHVFENSVYYGLLHASVLGILQTCMILEESTLWTVAAYCALFHAWSVVETARILPNCTLSFLCLAVSMSLFCFFTLPITLKNAIHGRSECFASVSDYILSTTHSHFIGWCIADACFFLFEPKIDMLK